MNQELTQKLLDKYPKLFSKIKRIYCPAGWFHLLDLSCQLMQSYADCNSPDETAQIAFTNINQHMGELRMFYVGGRASPFQTRMHEYLNSVKENAQKMSATICEETGKRGSKHRAIDGTIHTVSPEVAAANNMTPIVPVIAVKDTRSSPVELGPIGETLVIND